MYTVDRSPDTVEGYCMKRTHDECVSLKRIIQIHINQNPMNSNPKGTSLWDSLENSRQDLINLFLDPKIRFPLDLSNMCVLFSVNGVVNFFYYIPA